MIEDFIGSVNELIKGIEEGPILLFYMRKIILAHFFLKNLGVHWDNREMNPIHLHNIFFPFLLFIRKRDEMRKCEVLP